MIHHMNQYERDVFEFHEKHGYPNNQPPTPHTECGECEDLSAEIDNLVSRFQQLAINRSADGDPRLYRIVLMLEELGELALALGEAKSMDAILDAMGDSLYLNIGSLVTMGIPMDKLWNAIHESNMSKAVRDPDADPRLRDKGPDFHEPNLQPVKEAVGGPYV